MIALPHGESHRRINKSPGERYLAPRYREECDEFSQAQHDGDTDGGYNNVTEQKAQRTTGSKGPCGAQKEASTDDTSDAVKRSQSISIMERGVTALTRSSGHDDSSIHVGAPSQNQHHSRGWWIPHVLCRGS